MNNEIIGIIHPNYYNSLGYNALSPVRTREAIFADLTGRKMGLNLLSSFMRKTRLTVSLYP
jgi:hypothetical protein